MTGIERRIKALEEKTREKEVIATKTATMEELVVFFRSVLGDDYNAPTPNKEAI